MEIQQILTLLFTAVAVVLGVLILVKVNELITMLRTPIVKKLSPDMNLKPSSRHSIGAQEMASRGDRNTKDNRSNPNRDRSVVNKDSNRPDRPDRGERNDRPDRGMGQNRDRNNDRRNDRRNNNNRGDRPNRRPDFANAEFTPVETPVAAPAASGASESAPVSSSPVIHQEGRRPLAPRVPMNAPAAPAMESVSAAASVEVVGAEFDPSKVRYGRRNFVKKIPNVDEDSVPASAEVK
jgi:hypothetical protein